MSQHYLKMSELDLTNQRIIIREDLNVPINNEGIITSDARIQRALPTLKMAAQAGARVLVLSHLGRPQEGQFDQKFSLAPVAKALGNALGQMVPLVHDWINGIDIQPGQVILAENVRFNVGETGNDPKLAKQMASQCDIFVMDAFATAHRAQASTVGIAQFAPTACAGPLMDEELQALSHALKHPKRPVIAIVGGSKVSTKIQLLDALLQKVNQLIVGGGIANTFLKAQGFLIGQSLYEEAWLAEARRILQQANTQGVIIPLPTDVAVAKQFSAEAKATVKSVNKVNDNEMILDVGTKTAASYQQLMADAGTIIWNGPVGVFEFPAFRKGTQALGKAIASSHAFSIAGGGDTLAALDAFHITDKISYVSTGGGAFLEYLQGESLPAIAVLKSRARS